MVGISAQRFRFIDLFAGIGGLRRGFDAIGGRCVFTSEWDRFAQLTYRANYRDGPDHQFWGDITKLDLDSIPEHDVLLAGFPHQPFSITGVSKKNAFGQLHGFRCNTQSTLFYDLAHIIHRHRPKVFLLETVKNLLSYAGGRTFGVIRHALEDELGYEISVRAIDAKRFVPQRRERIFIAGVRRDLHCPVDLGRLELPDEASGPKLRTILHPEDGSEPADPPFTDERGQVDSRYTLSDHLWNYLREYADKHRQRRNGFGFGLICPDDVARTLSARYYRDGSEILVVQEDGCNPRRLTPRECARLMGFDAAGRSDFVIPVSDTQAYKQFGNAAVVPVVEAVARYMEHIVLQVVAPQPGSISAE